jgi:hypothetical protein
MATKRQYITESDIEDFSNISVTDSSEAEDQMNLAEELVDSYVGFVQKHVREDFSGLATSGGNNYLIDTSGDSPLKQYNDDYFTYCEIEIVGGTGKGQSRNISAFSKSSNKVTVSSNWDTNPDSTSFYVIRQVGKFPRREDVYQHTDNTYYKTIPEKVKKATLAQLEYIIEKGLDFFAGAVDYEAESLGDYSYKSKKANRNISPHARQLLKGLVIRTGKLRV